MIAALRSEFRKLLSIRSTYFLALAVVSLVVIIVFFSAYQSISGGEVLTPAFMSENISSTVLMTAQICAIFAALFMAHEYRYNLIFHTLTSIRSRALAIISKAAVVSVYALAVTAIVVAATVLTALFGIIFADGELPAQEFSTFSLLGRSVFYVLGFTLAGLLFAVWFRSVVLPVALLILLPNTVEPLASGLLSLGDKASYLPFTALQQVMLPSSAVGVWTLILVFSLYLVFGWVSGWILFSRRDAKT